MPERFDAGAGLVALGAVLLLVSLFVDWFEPGGDAWAVFEIADIVLAGCGVAGLLAVLPRYGVVASAVPWIAFGALVVVAVQIIDLPPAARGSDIATGAWLALGGTVVMAVGATLSAASISVTVDVRGRERRRRAAAIDARDGEPAPAEPEAEDEAAAEEDPRRARRRGSVASGGGGADLAGGPELWRGRRGTRAEPDEPDRGEGPAAEDPERTQALDPVDRPGEGS